MRKRLSILIAALVVALGLVALPATAQTAPDWAPAESADIHPGVQTMTEGAQCTSNFVFYDGTNIYIGQAAHCASTEGNTSTNGCETESHPLGTEVEVEGASQPGTLVYSSWLAMQEAGETDSSMCGHNDFALVQLDAADQDAVNPSIPHWGGPTGVTGSTDAGEKVYSYGNSSLRFGLEPTSPKEGYSLGEDSDGWNHQVYTLTPGIPGDSGSAFIDSDGAAFGVLSTVQIAPFAGSNGVSDVAEAMDYMTAHGGPSVTLAEGTEPFVGGPLP